MAKSALQIVLEKIVHAGDWDLEIRNYSGRGMLGRECLALCVYGTVPDPMHIGARIVSEAVRGVDSPDILLDDVLSAMTDTRSDNMGDGRVYYWPAVRYEDEE